MITRLELKRQIFHILVGVIIVTLLFFDLINFSIIILGFFFILALSILVKKGYKVFFFTYIFDKFGRKTEIEKFPAKGAVFYLLGSALAVFFFDKEIAIASILILAFGDSLSRLVGPYGFVKHPFNNNKFIEGIIVGGIGASLAASIFVPYFLAIPAAFVAMIVEGLDIEINWFKVDDNLTIPVVSGGVMLLITTFL